MITARAFAGKHYAVLGLARSGLATVEALLASGAKVTAWDDKEEARSSLQAKLAGRGTSVAGGGVDSPASARMKLMIQKRITTVGSLHPRCSK